MLAMSASDSRFRNCGDNRSIGFGQVRPRYFLDLLLRHTQQLVIAGIDHIRVVIKDRILSESLCPV